MPNCRCLALAAGRANPVMALPIEWLLVPAAALLISAGGLLMRASQVGGVTLYSHYSVILCSELLKLAIALALWRRRPTSNRSSALPCGFLRSPRELALFALPGSLYVLVNNVRFPILERINPGVYSVVWNLKIVGVAALLCCLLSRPISARQWGGVAVLVFGSSLAEVRLPSPHTYMYM